MGRGTRLTTKEQQSIAILHGKGVNCLQISKQIRRSECVVRNYIKNMENYGQKKSPGRPKVISNREKRAILRAASNSGLPARAIAAKAGVNTNVRNVQRILKAAPTIKRLKLQRKPQLKPEHQTARLVFARTHMDWTNQWQNVIFSDEKKFNLDGPDGFSYYFHDLRKEKLLLSRQHMGGKSVMVWAAIGFKNRSSIQFLPETLNSIRYRALLDNQLLSNGRTWAGGTFIFQQDNASVHTATIVNDWFKDHKIEKLNFPARSPDLNIIENVWGVLSREVYKGGKQYTDVNQLKVAIRTAWKKMSQKYIKNLYNSLPDRIAAVLIHNGKATKY